MQSFLLILELCENICIGTGIILNLVLIFLISRFTRKEVGAYKYLIMFFAIYGIIYMAAFVLFRDRIITHGHTFALFSIGLMADYKYSSPLYCCVFIANCALMDINFLYRYYAIKSPLLVQNFEKPRFILILCLVVLAGLVVWFLLCIFTFGTTSDALEDLSSLVAEKYDLDIYRLSFIMADYVRNGKINWLPCCGYLCFSVIISFCFSFMIFCGYSTAHFLNSTTLISSNAKRLHRRLQKILYVETVVPLICFYTPCVVCLTAPVLAVEVTLFADVITVVSALHPSIDAIVVIALMKDYRRGLASLLCPRVIYTPKVLPTTAESSVGAKISREMSNQVYIHSDGNKS